MLCELDTVFLAIELVFVGHGQFLRRNEMERGVEMTHGHDERVHGASVFQVTHQIDVEILQCALRLIDGVEVEHTLRGMPVGTVAGVDDGYGCYLAGILGCSFDVMAHGNHVGIVADHEDGVLERFALCSTGNLWVGKTDDTGTESVGCRFETQACAGGWFEGKCCHHFSLK